MNKLYSNYDQDVITRIVDHVQAKKNKLTTTRNRCQCVFAINIYYTYTHIYKYTNKCKLCYNKRIHTIIFNKGLCGKIEKHKRIKSVPFIN